MDTRIKENTLEEFRKANSAFFNNLRQVQEQGILTESEMLEKSTLKKEEIIKEHEKYHKITYAPKDNRWKTYLPDGSPKGKLIAKTRREDLDAVIIAFYTEQESAKKRYTLRNLYPDFIQHKKDLEKLADSSVERYQNSWDKLVNTAAKILDIDVRDLTRGKYKDWAMEYLNEYPMAKKSFDALHTVLNGIVRYAADKDIIDESPLNDLRIPTNCFEKHVPGPKKTPFNDDEVILLTYYLVEKYQSNPLYTVPLAILFLFQTGLRPAEIVGIRFSDIDSGNYLHIQRHLAKTYGTDGKLSETEIRDTVKTKARHEPVYIPEEAQNILTLVKMANEENGDVDDDYIFYSNHQPVTPASISSLLRRACETLGITPRGPYMIRKTYATILADAGISLTIITSQMGHADSSTTFKFYVEARNTREQASEQLERALQEKLPSIESVIPCNTFSQKKKAPKTA